MSYGTALSQLAPRAALVLSDNTAVEAVLTNIPLFCVGILALAISTFFLAMRKITLIAIYLYSSALLAFAAGVLDLSQILGRGQLIDQGGVNGLVNTREVALSLSVGFRFLFYWSFIAERPRGEPPPPNPEELDVRYNPRIHTHSADWQRWGYLGLFLKWGLLALTFSIPILHIVWRILARRFALVYMVETTIEIVVTSIFILKIFLNLFLSPVFPWWKLTSWYITPIIALGLNLGVAAGNLGYFLFTETTLGRFILAVELYLLIVFILISSFYRQSPATDIMARTDMTRQMKGTSSFAGLAQKIDYPRSDADSRGAPFSSAEELSAPQQQPPMSAPSRMSWTRALGTRRASTGWGRGDIEEGTPNSEVPEMPNPYQAQDIRAPTEAEPSQTTPVVEERPDVVPTVSVNRATGVSFSSYYEQARPATVALDPPVLAAARARDGAESPVYGLNGIMRPSASANRGSTGSKRATMSSFDELIRQQTELDKSIAALRIFSTPDIKGKGKMLTPLKPSTKARITSNSTNSWGRGLDSASNRSEFSLSIFPAPPLQSRDDASSVPSSPSQRDVLRPEMTRLGSNGTQYDVTSFIGDLSVPTLISGNSRRRSTLGPGNTFSQDLSDVESEDEMASPVISKARTVFVRNIAPMEPTASMLGPATASSGLLSAAVPTANTPQVPLTAKSYASAIPAVPSPLSNSFPVIRNPVTIPSGPRGPLRPRSASTSNINAAVNPVRKVRVSNISGPRPLAGAEPVADAFERPRQPPLFLNRKPERP